MSRRTPAIIIKDILQCIEHIQLYTSTIQFDVFSSNYMITEACLYNIQIIGEAITHISDDIKDSNPQIPWRLIKGMRNRLIHEYFGTDLPLVWQVITTDLPVFKSELEIILKNLPV